LVDLSKNKILDRYKNMENIDGIIPLLVNDLKRSKERIAELETRMKNLEEQLSRMI
jgi:hypothetical protein